MSDLRVVPLEGMPEITEGDDVAAEIARAGAGLLADGDVLVIAQKIVSKSEGRFVDADNRRRAARDEAVRVLRRVGEMIISETRHGFVCANSGVDASNVPGARVLLLPMNPDLSARRIRARLGRDPGVDVGVVIADTFGRAWRLGQTNVAIGVAGFSPFIDQRGRTDAHGRELSATRICIADQIAGAAEIVMGKTERIPVAVVRGAPVSWGRGSAVEIVRPHDEDLFR